MIGATGKVPWNRSSLCSKRGCCEEWPVRLIWRTTACSVVHESKQSVIHPHRRPDCRFARQQIRWRVCVAMSQSTEQRAPEVTSIIDFMHLVESLKKQPRKGWVLRGVKHPESIADHMYRMAVLALTMAGSHDIDQPRLVKMAIVHDIAEAIVGDITPVCGISEDEKHRQELSAIMKIQEVLGPNTGVAAEVVELWKEYEAGTTAEAKLCKDFDKVEMIMQAYEYEHDQQLNLQEFFDSTAGKWRTSLGCCPLTIFRINLQSRTCQGVGCSAVRILQKRLFAGELKQRSSFSNVRPQSPPGNGLHLQDPSPIPDVVAGWVHIVCFKLSMLSVAGSGGLIPSVYHNLSRAP